jgi:hypothetical protein
MLCALRNFKKRAQGRRVAPDGPEVDAALCYQGAESDQNAQARSTREMNASDSPNARTPTIGAAPHFVGPHEFNDVRGEAMNRIFERHRLTGDKEMRRLVP